MAFNKSNNINININMSNNTTLPLSLPKLTRQYAETPESFVRDIEELCNGCHVCNHVIYSSHVLFGINNMKNYTGFVKFNDDLLNKIQKWRSRETENRIVRKHGYTQKWQKWQK
jgi:hypothetical protein